MTWLILSVPAADFFTIPAAAWFFPNKITTSYFECVHKAKTGTIKFYQFVKIHFSKVIEITKQNFSDIFDEEGEAAVKNGLVSGCCSQLNETRQTKNSRYCKSRFICFKKNV
jgi:hypothetical protein